MRAARQSLSAIQVLSMGTPISFRVGFLLLLAFWGRADTAVAQPFALRITGDDIPGQSPASTFPDSAALLTYLDNWLARQRGSAYWEASVDSLYRIDARTFGAVLHRGPRYQWGTLAPPAGVLPRRWARQAGYRPRQFRGGRRLQPAAWRSLQDSIARRAADAGYPFATVRLDSLRWQAASTLAARIRVSPGPLIRTGAIRFPEAVRVRSLFLERYLGLRPGQPYRHDRVRRIPDRLAQLPYLTLKGSPSVRFQDSLVFFDLPLERRPASRFDFVIGVLPGGGNDNRLLLTGELNGALYNGLGQGERIAARFEQLRPQTQELALGIDYPFLLNLPFGLEGSLDLYRRDSSFLNLNWQLAATYLREGNDRLSFFWENRRSLIPGGAQDTPRPLATDTLGVIRSFFGLRARRQRTDRRFSPRRGYTADVSVAAGFRRLTDGVTGDSLAARSAQFKAEAQLAAYLPALRGTVVYLGLRGAALLGQQEVLANEQYRIGGARLLRGFNEQTIFARDYQLLTAEFRLLLGGNAFLYAFVDAARVNTRSRAQPERPIDYPLGFGAGVNFETRAGIFAFALALGQRNGIPLDLGQPKVHLGYISLF